MLVKDVQPGQTIVVDRQCLVSHQASIGLGRKPQAVAVACYLLAPQTASPHSDRVATSVVSVDSHYPKVNSGSTCR